MAALNLQDRACPVWNGRLTLHIKTVGRGAPLIYLHPAAGLAFDPFLGALSERYTIYAPEHPGTSAGDPEAIHQVDSIWDLVLVYEEAIRSLRLTEPPIVIGQSFGGMMACELAAHFPGLFRKMVVLGPIGLWREDLPIANWITTPPPLLPALLFKDPQCAAAQAALAMPPDPEQALAATAGLVWALGCTGKFAWPIPDRGLSKRIHRIQVPTLIVWGADDALIPSGYAEEFHRRIPGSRVAIVPDCGHIPQVEKGVETLRLVSAFLAE